MRNKIGLPIAKYPAIKILMNHSVVKKKMGFNPTLFSLPVTLLSKIYGFPPPPFRTSRPRLNSENFIVQKALEKPIKKFLEFGSGFGNIALTISNLSKAKGTCIDMDEEDISVLNKLASIANLDCRGEVGNILNMKFDKGTFDLIYSLEVLEHIEDIRLLLVLSNEWLSPGGRFIFQTPFHFEIMADETEHEFGHVRNGFNESEFEKYNKALFSFEFLRFETRSDSCKFCSQAKEGSHPLKLIGIGTKK
ncbi:MAG: class I SAM-dependent methyltransferase [Melioribacteraceae bacterium]|nr:class I SAM-dependent methyltransferase [Melioribacteraceae bacterium]MCF8264844.1 class I SAM-dependent methyltransferase [Melioribacteraceae bacterium]MCF8297309.1 class I SAM-dependent methyltransferase [Saprospiraceae bacterium]